MCSGRMLAERPGSAIALHLNQSYRAIVEIFSVYIWICIMVHVHSFAGSVKFPHKHSCVAILEATKRLRTMKPSSPDYPKTLWTLSDHIKKKRLDLRLLQKDVARILDVDTMTVCNWARNRCRPRLYLNPKIIDFLGNDSFPEPEGTITQQIRQYRKKHGLSIKKFASQLGIDPTTLARWERNESKPSVKLSSLPKGNFIPAFLVWSNVFSFRTL